MLSIRKTALRALFCRPQAEHDLDEELHYHVEQLFTKDLKRLVRGISHKNSARCNRKSFVFIPAVKMPLCNFRLCRFQSLR
jgi:hypothetical protein